MHSVVRAEGSGEVFVGAKSPTSGLTVMTSDTVCLGAAPRLCVMHHGIPRTRAIEATEEQTQCVTTNQAQDLGDTKTWQVPQCVDSLLLCKTLTDIKLDRQMASRS